MSGPSKKTALHPKWLVLIVFSLIAYGLAQPKINQRFGWNLPSLAALLGSSEEASNERRTKQSEAVAKDDVAQGALPEAQFHSPVVLVDPEPRRPESNKQDAYPSQSTTTSPVEKAQNSGQQDQRLHGLLRETRRDEYVSPAGLRYTRGSEEGHRLRHIAKHLEDQPDRPGRHGVFEGDMHQVLLWLDEAYKRSKAGARGTKKRFEDDRTVYEVSFDTPLGYIGGRDGRRAGNPKSKRLRLVVDEDRVITAFPF